MEFDILKIFELLKENGYELDIYPVEDGRIRIKVRTNNAYASHTIDLNHATYRLGNTNNILIRDIIATILRLKNHDNHLTHKLCACGGILCDTSGGKCPHFRCLACGKTYLKTELEFDNLEVNPNTGWIFPMVKHEKEELEK